MEFKRNWADYENGFGDLNGEFWLGLDVISHIADQGSYDLRFDLEDFEGEKRYAVYEDFSLDREDMYRYGHTNLIFRISDFPQATVT